MRRLLFLAAILLGSGCGPVPEVPFIPNINGNYAFTMTYSGTCATSQNPGTCAISPVALLQTDDQIVVQPFGPGVIEELVVVFASDGVNVCDLSEADLTFAGIFDGTDINGTVSGTMQRTGFGECTVQNGTFRLDRIP